MSGLQQDGSALALLTKRPRLRYVRAQCHPTSHNSRHIFFFSCFFINLEKEPAPHTQLLERQEHHRQEEGGAAEEWSSWACQGVSHAERDPSSQALDKTLQEGQKDRSWE